MEIFPPPYKIAFRLAIFHSLGKILNNTARHTILQNKLK